MEEEPECTTGRVEGTRGSSQLVDFLDGVGGVCCEKVLEPLAKDVGARRGDVGVWGQVTAVKQVIEVVVVTVVGFAETNELVALLPV